MTVNVNKTIKISENDKKCLKKSKKIICRQCRKKRLEIVTNAQTDNATNRFVKCERVLNVSKKYLPRI